MCAGKKVVEIFLAQEREIGVGTDLLSHTKIFFGNDVDADFVAEFFGFVPPSRHSDGKDVRIVRVVEYGVGIVYRAIDRIGVDVAEVRLVVCLLVVDLPVGICFDESVFMPLVFDENGIVFHVASREQQLGIGAVAAAAARFGTVFFEGGVDLCVQIFLLQSVVKSVGFQPSICQICDVRLHRRYRGFLFHGRCSFVPVMRDCCFMKIIACSRRIVKRQKNTGTMHCALCPCSVSGDQ